MKLCNTEIADLYLLFADKHKKVTRYTSCAWSLLIVYNAALNEYLFWMIRRIKSDNAE